MDDLVDDPENKPAEKPAMQPVEDTDREIKALFEQAAVNRSYVSCEQIKRVTENVFADPDIDSHPIVSRSVRTFLSIYGGIRVRDPETNEILGYRFNESTFSSSRSP